MKIDLLSRVRTIVNTLDPMSWLLGLMRTPTVPDAILSEDTSMIKEEATDEDEASKV